MNASIAEILKGKYPAKSHLARITSYLNSYQDPLSSSSTSPPATHFYLESARTRMNEDNDQEAPFRQRRYFFYVTGCELADSALVYDVEREWSTLFIPPVEDDSVVWSGLPMLPKEAMKRYDVDEVLTTSSLDSFLQKAAQSSTTTKNILTIPNQISLTTPSHLSTHFPTSSFASMHLKTAIEESRVIKTPYEIALLKHANNISTLAHRAAMRSARTATSEAEIEAAFLEVCVRSGNKLQAYSSIVASGVDAATLHYVRNNKKLVKEKGKQETLNVLLDAGCEERCYAADITRIFPISGTFSPESRSIYTIVLRMQKECMKILKAGVIWDDVHLLAHRIAIDGLLELGILRNGNVEEILESRVSTAFMPHGLGHYLGLDTHDTGGHADYADKDPMFRYLRVRGSVPAGAVITVEPGVYFCRFILEPCLKDAGKGGKYIDEEVLERYWSVGGVRIEDDVLVLEDGCESLSLVEKEVEDVEALVRGER